MERKTLEQQLIHTAGNKSVHKLILSLSLINCVDVRFHSVFNYE